MEEVIRHLSSFENCKELLKATCKMNKVSVLKLNGFTFAKIERIYARTFRHYELWPEKAKKQWFQNELRLFHWILIVQSFITNILINQFNPTHWQTINKYFKPKTQNILQYEAIKFIKEEENTYHRPWTQQQSHLLSTVLQDKSLITHWNQVARKFYQLSKGQNYRSGKQCREQWFNHLDKSKKHGNWSEDQDRNILKFVLKKGHRWAVLSRQNFIDRTEHMLKNRFNTLLIKGKQEKEPIQTHQRSIIRRLLKDMNHSIQKIQTQQLNHNLSQSKPIQHPVSTKFIQINSNSDIHPQAIPEYQQPSNNPNPPINSQQILYPMQYSIFPYQLYVHSFYQNEFEQYSIMNFSVHNFLQHLNSIQQSRNQ